MSKLWYKHPGGRRFRWVIRLPWPGYHIATISHIRFSSGGTWLELMYNGRMYGRFYRRWRTDRPNPKETEDE